MAARIDGLAAMKRDLRELGPGVAMAVRQVNRFYAEETVKRAMERVGPPGRLVSARVRGSVAAQFAQTFASVSAGGSSAPEFYGQEFGGRRRARTMQFRPHLGKRGYWLSPAAREVSGELSKEFWARLDEAVLKKLFPG